MTSHLLIIALPLAITAPLAPIPLLLRKMHLCCLEHTSVKGWLVWTTCGIANTKNRAGRIAGQQKSQLVHAQTTCIANARLWKGVHRLQLHAQAQRRAARMARTTHYHCQARGSRLAIDPGDFEVE